MASSARLLAFVQLERCNLNGCWRAGVNLFVTWFLDTNTSCSNCGSQKAAKSQRMEMLLTREDTTSFYHLLDFGLATSPSLGTDDFIEC